MHLKDAATKTNKIVGNYIGTNAGDLATIGNNAPFIGLLGTVLGIIHAFQDLSMNMAEASSGVMGGISEALVATAIGLVVAIPAVIAFNTFKSRVKKCSANTDLLAKTLLSQLKAAPAQAASTHSASVDVEV